MKRTNLFILFFILFCAQAIADSSKEISVRTFFEHAKFNNIKVSPDGQNVAFTYQDDTEVKLAVMRLKDKAILSSFAFGKNKHVIDFHWANETRVLMEVTEVLGHLTSASDSFVELFAANIDGTRRIELFKVQTSIYTILHLLPEQPDRILIGKRYFDDKDGMRAFTLDIYRGRERYLDAQPQGYIAGLIADNSGVVRIGVEFIDGKSIDENRLVIHYKNNDTWQKLDLPSKRANPTIEPLGFSADNSKAYFSSNFDMETADVAGLFVYDFATSNITLLARHHYSDIGKAFYSHDGEVLAVGYESTINDVEFVNAEHQDAKLLAGLRAAFPGQTVSITSFNREGNIALFRVSSDKNSGEFFIFDTKTGKANYLASARPELNPDLMHAMREINFTARDGLEIRGLLTMPNHVKKNAPLIVNVHGGPFGVSDSWGFNSEAQFFASKGYATLQINFRGSGGYGDDFVRAGRLQWGHKMQDDITDGTLWAIEQGFADKERICIYGGSYGGYAALWGVIKEPSLYKCSVGYAGVYDMPIFFRKDGSDASRGGRSEQYLTSHIGEDAAYLRSISPVHNVNKIQVPLFLVHGSNDVRVPIIHANNLRKALDDAGKQYEWLERKEGHGFFNVDNREDLYKKMLAFFDKQIGK